MRNREGTDPEETQTECIPHSESHRSNAEAERPRPCLTLDATLTSTPSRATLRHFASAYIIITIFQIFLNISGKQILEIVDR